MPLFLLTFFFIYGSFHLYVFLKARAAFSFGKKIGIPLAFFMLVMVTAPVLVHVFENFGLNSLARFLAWFSYIWMGILFFFVSIVLVVDLYRCGLAISSRIFSVDVSRFRIGPRIVFLVPLVLTLAANAYGYIEAQNIRTEKIEYKSPKIREKLRIVQFSDVHLGLMVRQKHLGLIVEEINNASPDILVCTGDLVDGDMKNLEGLSELLREIRPRFGKFAVTGNHEFYAGIDKSMEFMEKSGFTVLRGKVQNIEGLINIAGVDDRGHSYMGLLETISENDLLNSIANDNFTLLLKHRPNLDQDSAGLFDLQLSGHTHGGQIFPFGLLTRLYFPEQARCQSQTGDCRLHVTNGAGTWGPPVRILAPPEITLLELVPDN